VSVFILYILHANAINIDVFRTLEIEVGYISNLGELSNLDTSSVSRPAIRSNVTASTIPHPMERLEPVWAEGDFECVLASALLVTIFTYGHL